MAETAPDALRWLGGRIAPDLGGVLSGIIGDSDHKTGYHRGRAYVPSTDYSVWLTEDKLGSKYYACAIDMSFSTAKMKLYTGRLKAAAERNDPRVRFIREFYGTINGTDVFGRTHKGSADATWEWATSDKSHLWHLHISILREYSDNMAVMQGILDVLMGKPLVVPVSEDEMDARQERLVIGGEVAKENALFFWLRTMADQNDAVTKEIWGQGGFGPGIKQVADMVTTLRTELTARDAAEKVRDAANAAAVKGLTDALNKLVSGSGGASIDPAPILAAIKASSDAAAAEFSKLQVALADKDAEIDDLRRRLAAAAQAEANALND